MSDPRYIVRQVKTRHWLWAVWDTQRRIWVDSDREQSRMVALADRLTREERDAPDAAQRYRKLLDSAKNARRAGQA